MSTHSKSSTLLITEQNCFVLSDMHLDLQLICKASQLQNDRIPMKCKYSVEFSFVTDIFTKINTKGFRSFSDTYM